MKNYKDFMIEGERETLPKGFDKIPLPKTKSKQKKPEPPSEIEIGPQEYDPDKSLWGKRPKVYTPVQVRRMRGDK